MRLLLGNQAVGLQALRDCAEQARRRREIGDARSIFMTGQLLDQPSPVVVRKRVGLDVVNALLERLPVCRVEVAVGQLFSQRLLNERQVFFASQRTTTRRYDAAVRRHLAIAVTVIERRQQLAHRKITGSTKNNQVERIDRYELSHGASSKYFCNFTTFLCFASIL